MDDLQTGGDVDETLMEELARAGDSVVEAFFGIKEARQRIAAARKDRQYTRRPAFGGAAPAPSRPAAPRGPPAPGAKSLEERKRNSVCNDCGEKGLWVGDSACKRPGAKARPAAPKGPAGRGRPMASIGPRRAYVAQTEEAMISEVEHTAMHTEHVPSFLRPT